MRSRLDDFSSKTHMETDPSIRGGGATEFQTSLAHTTHAKSRNWELALDLTPGVILCDSFLLFVRVGVGFNQFSVNSTATFNYTDNNTNTVTPADIALASNFAGSKKRAGLRLGLGAAHYIGDDLVLTLNYIYTDFGKISTGDTIEVPQPIVPLLPFKTHFNPGSTTWLKRQSLMIGLNYYFAL